MKENIVITLDNNQKYVVVKQIRLDDYDYLILGNINDNENKDIMVCKLEDLKLTKITDINLINKILKDIYY